MKTYVGIDNGVTGAIGIVGEHVKPTWFSMPVKKELSYTKKKKFITRIDSVRLQNILKMYDRSNPVVFIERPMVNPTRFTATLSAMRALEATLVVLETLEIPYQYVDSKEWQKEMLPEGLEGDELKKASLQIGRRMWPSIPFKPDADAMLLAEAFRRKQL